MVTIWVLVFFFNQSAITLSKYPNEVMCESVKAKAIDKKLDIECIGEVVPSSSEVKNFEMRNWI
jgi:hypothetical protein